MGNHYRYNLENTRSCKIRPQKMKKNKAPRKQGPRKWWMGAKAITRQKP
jgi:hypothetical protein